MLGIVGIFAIPVIAAVLAIVLGSSARREIQSDPALGGEGLASAGVILGWIGVALMVFWFVLFLAVL